MARNFSFGGFDPCISMRDV